ncbi:double zinc ribbon and ankyrin repeat-containing protein 1-like isoform X2 [Salvelinus alpinus]|uniref:double zinc ribbon and ankyrin repeat-containing protein 1-like isoform X2 n=1 Tax=Salvelinus alpinus TaxID=8036 RepID=UPI0039FDDDF8
MKRPGFGENSTLKYSGPICLPEDKVSVIALAITSLVTKLFLVEYVPSDEPPSIEDKEENFLKEYEGGLPRQEMGTENGSGDASLKLQDCKLGRQSFQKPNQHSNVKDPKGDRLSEVWVSLLSLDGLVCPL